METVQKSKAGKNALWTAYRDAGPVKHAEIMVALKESGLHKHWMAWASKEGYDLKMAKAPLRDIFLKVLPETAPLFGLKPPRHHKPDPVPRPAPLFDAAQD